MYVYISPKNLVKSNVNVLKEYCLRSQGGAAQHGMISSDSESARFIEVKSDAANHLDCCRILTLVMLCLCLLGIG